MRSLKIPATVTTMSNLPKVSIASLTISSPASKEATDILFAFACPPAFIIPSTTSSANDAFSTLPSRDNPGSTTKIFAPCAARSSATARPIP